jgi:hypothetical protein
MTRKELNLEGMLRSVAEGLDNNQPLISDKFAIVTAHVQLKSNLTEIKDLQKKQAVSTKPDTAIKGSKKENMLTNLLVVKAGVGAVGVQKNDLRLKAVSAVTEPALRNMRESLLVIAGHEIYEAALTILPELAEWGVTKEEVDDLGESTDSYLSQNPTIRNIKARSTQATAEIKVKLNESHLLVKETLDPLMLPFKKINPTFYGEYQNTRIIVERAATHPKQDSKVTETPETK